MKTRRAQRQKGSNFEYDVQHSVSKLYFDVYRTSERGFQKQYDLQCDGKKLVIECKRHAKFSWNELVKYYDKLSKVKPDGYTCVIVFQGNRQPVLVFDGTKIVEFEDYFWGAEFEKHPSTRVKKNG